MKKIISAALSAIMVLSSIGTVSTYAEKYGDGDNIVVLGDSIASGYGLDAKEYSYAQIVADYMDANLENYAAAGATTEETLAAVRSFDAEKKAQLAEADVVILSVGANDIIEYSSRFILDFAARNDLLKDGYTAENIPEKPSFGDIKKLMSRDKVSEFAKDDSNLFRMNTALLQLRAHMIFTESTPNYEKYDRVIQTRIIPNIEAIIAEIRSVNPNARIVLQTIYDPFQLQEEYCNANFSSSYLRVLNNFRPRFKDIIAAFATQASNIEGVEIADVHGDFSSFSDNADGCSWYFTKMQDGRDNMDVHPSQRGHLAIAATILDTLGEKREDGGILNRTYILTENKEAYPSYALARYEKVKGAYSLGDMDESGTFAPDDASHILQEYAVLATGNPSSLPENLQKAADTTRDGEISPDDASTALSYYAYCATGGTGSFKYFLAEKK